MRPMEAGFTLVEMVIVIVFLGIIAAVAIPKFIDLSSDAKTAATNNIAASLSSENAVNYALRKANPTKGIAIINCTGVANTLKNGLPHGYTITAAAVAVDVTVSCTLMGPSTTIASFSATGIN